MSTSSSKVTMVDVSRLAGCSKAVVSAVVNHARGNIAVSPTTRARVLAAAQQLGYRPNFASRSLARRSTRTVGIYVPPRPDASLGYGYEGRILRGIELACREHNYDLLLLNIGGGVTPDQCFHTMAEGRVDGLLLLHVLDDADWVAPLVRQCPNVAAVNYYGPVRELTVVRFDDAAATRLAVDHLVALGHQRIGYVGAVSCDLGPGGRLRCAGFQAALAAHGLASDPNWLWDISNPRFRAPVPPGWSANEGADAVRHFLTLAPAARPTALVCYDDTIAVLAMHLLIENQVRVPADMSVVGIDDTELSRLVRPTLTSIHQPLEDMGRHAATAIITGAAARPNLDKEGDHMKPANVCAPELKARFSTARPGGTRFTLIELLVVVAIISILAAMLLPAIQRAKALSVGTACRGNMKQVNQGMALYADDSDDYYPPLYMHYKGSDATYGVPYTGKGQTWTNEQYVPWHSSSIAGLYFGNTSLEAGSNGELKPSTMACVCPAAFKWNPGSPQNQTWIGYNYYDNSHGTIWSNVTATIECRTDDNGGYKNGNTWFRTSIAKTADKVFTLVDVYSGYRWQFYSVGHISLNAASYEPRHVGQANLAFLDGHCDDTRDLNADYSAGRLTNVLK